MTKRKPEKVIEYRISLQDKERELLEHLVYVEGTAKAFNQFTEPFVEILKDISALTVIFSALAGLLGTKFVLGPGIDTDGDLIQDFQGQYDGWKESLDESQQQATSATEIMLGTLPGVGPIFKLLFR